MRVRIRVVIVLSALVLVGTVPVVLGQGLRGQELPVHPALLGSVIVGSAHGVATQRVPLDGLRLVTCYGDVDVCGGAAEVAWESLSVRNGSRSWRYRLVLSAAALCACGCRPVMLIGTITGEVTEGAAAESVALALKAGGSADVRHRFTTVHSDLLTSGEAVLVMTIGLEAGAETPQLRCLRFERA